MFARRFRGQGLWDVRPLAHHDGVRPAIEQFKG
jgi:hypothetical protein